MVKERTKSSSGILNRQGIQVLIVFLSTQKKTEIATKFGCYTNRSTGCTESDKMK